MSGGNIMSFEGCNYFRQRLILSTLSGKTVRIKKIRSKEDDPGLKGDFKMNNVIVWLYCKKKKGHVAGLFHFLDADVYICYLAWRPNIHSIKNI